MEYVSRNGKNKLDELHTQLGMDYVKKVTWQIPGLEILEKCMYFFFSRGNILLFVIGSLKLPQAYRQGGGGGGGGES